MTSGTYDSLFLREALAGLGAEPKRLPSKYFYDAQGSELFERITTLPEYYPTRTELGIMESNRQEMAEVVGPRAAVIEYGSGSGLKTRYLLSSLLDPQGYVPVEISRTALDASVRALSEELPSLAVTPVCADYTRPFALPELATRAARRVVYFPGSTIGNFTPSHALEFLALMREQVGPGGGLVIGVDLVKDPATLHAAYNDADGVTAAFNRNVLARLRRELGAEVDPDAFAHYAFFQPEHSRIEMHLMSLQSQEIRIQDHIFSLKHGETILTEFSYKYSVEALQNLAQGAGWTPARVWLDEDELFSVHYLEAR